MDDKGLVDLAKLRSMRNRTKMRGKNAYCFVIDNKLIKIYASVDDWNFGYLDGNLVTDLSMFKADTIVFPDEYIYENGVKCGEIQEYIKDESMLLSFNSQTKIKPLIENYEYVINDLMTFSNLIMNDLCGVNTLYSQKNGFYIIDTTEWELGKNTSKANIYRFNLLVVNEIFRYIDMPIAYNGHFYLNNPNICKNCIKFGNVGINFYKLLIENVENRYNFIDFIYAYIALYRKYCNQEMKTFKEMDEFTKVLKKG